MSDKQKYLWLAPLAHTKCRDTHTMRLPQLSSPAASGPEWGLRLAALGGQLAAGVGKLKLGYRRRLASTRRCCCCVVCCPPLSSPTGIGRWMMGHCAVSPGPRVFRCVAMFMDTVLPFDPGIPDLQRDGDQQRRRPAAGPNPAGAESRARQAAQPIRQPASGGCSSHPPPRQRAFLFHPTRVGHANSLIFGTTAGC